MKDITATEIEERYKNCRMETTVSDKYLEEHLDAIAKFMEEIAGMPKEELGKRQPGEKCMYEQFNINGEKK